MLTGNNQETHKQVIEGVHKPSGAPAPVGRDWLKPAAQQERVLVKHQYARGPPRSTRSEPPGAKAPADGY